MKGQRGGRKHGPPPSPSNRDNYHLMLSFHLKGRDRHPTEQSQRGTEEVGKDGNGAGEEGGDE